MAAKLNFAVGEIVFLSRQLDKGKDDFIIKRRW